MRMLVVGMDGVSFETFNRGWTPFIKNLIENGSRLELKEDLISRGWAEIVLGQNASTTRAVYEGPIADGSHTWTDKYKLADTPGLGVAVKPIWQVLNERGYTVGIMNVPTTFPAPEVDGFFVSGGGGGGPIGQDVTSEQCYPPSIQKGLDAAGYIVDERLPSLLGEKKLYNPLDLFDRLGLMNAKRTDSFVRLAKEYNIDFGFVVYKSSPVTAETLVLPELETGMTSGNSDLCRAVELFYRKFDKEVKKLVESFPDAHLLMVSDHSMAVRKYSVNANAFLVETGFQTPSRSRATIYSSIKSLKQYVPSSIKKVLKRSQVIKSSYESMSTFDAKSSKAFSISFSQGQHGIFINDKDRFGGPVAVQDIQKYKNKISQAFNVHPDSLKHDLKAIPIDAAKVPQYPDIVLDLPDGYLTSGEIKKFVEKYTLGKESHDLRQTAKGCYHTIKAHHPLAINCRGDWTVSPSTGKADLTLIYDHVLNFFS